MGNFNIVQFVRFETTLDKDQFIQRWEEYYSSSNKHANVILQQCKTGDIFKYLVQHRCREGGLRFLFSKVANKSRIRRAVINAEQAGGYAVLQLERANETVARESKIFAFLASPLIDLNLYRQIDVPAKLNIYEAYYENCSYAYILEFFVKNINASELLEKIKKYNPTEIGTYKEFAFSTAQSV
jgi:hypothetical protein